MEYLRWRNDEPLTWPSPGVMPYEIAMAFRYMVSTYNKNSVSAAHSHDDEIARLQKLAGG